VSQDVRLAFSCPHLTVEEVITLGSDRMSLPTKQPVAGGFIQLRANDSVTIPSQGLSTNASLIGAFSGPFRIIRNEQTFSVISSKETLSITLPYSTTERLSVQDVIVALKAQASSIAVEDANGCLKLTDSDSTGSTSVIQVSGLAASALGFTGQLGARGHKVYPGWTLAKPTGSLTKSLKFVEPLQSNPTLTVSYTVDRYKCLRCRGYGIENDYRFDQHGNMAMITNENLLVQAAQKLLLTTQGSNPYHTFYGTSIQNKIGSKAVGNVAASLSEEVRRALKTFQKIQAEQAKYQQVTFKERLYEVVTVRTTSDKNNPTMYVVDVVLRNASSDPVSISIVYTVPGVVALPGTNGLSLG